VAGDGQDPLSLHVELALSAATPDRRVLERRRETRHPFPYPIHLTPVDDEGRPQLADAITVLGKHLSNHGLDFYHREPLAWRYAVASISGGEHRWLGFLMELTWCRFGQHGWYDNGGRFLSVTQSPLTLARLA